MNFKFYMDILLDWFIKSGIEILLILFLMFLAIKFVNKFTEKIIKNIVSPNGDDELQKRVQTLRSISKSSLKIIILAVGSMIILEKIGINIAPMLAAAGVVGVAVGFGSQRFVEDIISGLIILIDDQIRVGDVVKIGDKSGLVEKVDLKMVVLRDLEGNVHFIRNGKIDIVTNMTKEFSFYVFDISVAYKENIDTVIEVIKSVDEELRRDDSFNQDILEPLEIFGLDKFDESSIVIKARIKTKPIKQWAVGREFNRRLKIAFDKHNIEIPFPQRAVHTISD